MKIVTALRQINPSSGGFASGLPVCEAAQSPEEGHVRTLVKACLLLFVATATASAQRRLTGKVESTTGEPLPGASVNVVGTLVGSTTSNEGKFTFMVPTAG